MERLSPFLVRITHHENQVAWRGGPAPVRERALRLGGSGVRGHVIHGRSARGGPKSDRRADADGVLARFPYDIVTTSYGTELSRVASSEWRPLALVRVGVEVALR